uniref:Uncharacterized protein n=1 Tax=Tanacetum cinerariifolium TaxID=118510 RepID=A0A6L2LGK4_TANCI|nr:hypothetical protein [Tanacetum cinerariifolium]
MKTGERTLAKDKVPLLKKTEGRVISPFVEIISLVDHTIQDELKANGAMKKKKVAFVAGSPPRLIKQGATEAAGSSSADPATKDFASSSINPISEHEYEDDSDHGDNVRTCPPSGHFTVLSSNSADTDILASPRVVPSTTVVESEDEIRDTSAPEIEVGGLLFQRLRLRLYLLRPVRGLQPMVFMSLSPLIPLPLKTFMFLASNDGFLNCFNINSAQHTSMVSELRLRFEHEIMSQEKFEKKFTESVAIIRQRDIEINDLNVKLEKAESEEAKVTALRQHVTKLEVATTKVVALNVQNVELLGKVSSLELVRHELDVKVSKLTTDCKILRSKVVGETKMRKEFKSIQDAAA